MPLRPSAALRTPRARALTPGARLAAVLPLLTVVLSAAPLPARAQDTWAPGSLAGTGRISLLGGWRHSSNGTLLRRLEAQGEPAAGPSPGGPLAVASFAYAPSEVVDVGIDLFATAERLWRGGPPAPFGVTYGALLGVRLQTLTGPVGPFEALQPAVGLHTGPTLVVAVDRAGQGVETFTQAWAASAGLTARLPGRWGLSLEYRFLVARGQVPGRGSFNGGGNWLLVGATYTFPPRGPSGWRRHGGRLSWLEGSRPG